MYIKCIASDYYGIKLPVDSPWMYAFEYAERGFKVLPLYKGSKDPATWLVRHGVNDATNDLDVIRDWARRNPDGNYGIAMGDGIIALDPDCPEAIRKIEELGSPLTQVHRTGRGKRHYLYAVDQPVANSSKIWGASMPCDIKSQGGYIVGPGSRFQGGSYTEVFTEEIADAPEWLLEALKERSEVSATVTRPTQASDTPMPVSVANALNDTRKGKHDRCYHQVVKPLVRAGWTDHQIIDALVGSKLLKARGRKVRVPRLYVQQMIDSAAKWIAAHPAYSAVDVDGWVANLHQFKPRGHQLRVWQRMAECARRSSTFVLSSRDVEADIGVPNASADRAMRRAEEHGIVELVFTPTRGSLERRVWRLKEIPETGTRVVALACAPSGEATKLGVPLPGKLISHDAFGHTKLGNAYTVLAALSDSKKLNVKHLAAITGYSRSSTYMYLARLIRYGLITKCAGGWIRKTTSKLALGLDAFARRTGMTGYLAGRFEIVATARADRLDARHEELQRRRWQRDVQFAAHQARIADIALVAA